MGNCFASIMSNIIYFSEKFSMFISFASLISCAIICMVSMLAFGIGLGYNYSFVDNRAKHTYIAAQYKKTRPANYHGPGYYVPTKKYGQPKPNKVPIWTARPAPGPIYNDGKGEFIIPTTNTTANTTSPTNATSFTTPANYTTPSDFTTPPGYTTVAGQSGYGTVTYPGAFRVKLVKLATENQLEPFNLKIARTKPRKFSFNLQSRNYSTTEMKDLNESESVSALVSKTHNKFVFPFVIKTVMQPSELSKWLTKLREENITFAVHVATN